MNQNLQKASNKTEVPEIARRMAREYLAIKKRNRNCLPQDLNEVGFTSDQVFEHWEEAMALVDKNKSNELWED